MLSIFHRETLNDFQSYNRLGEAESFLNDFQWTDQAFRDFQSVNQNGVHLVACGSQVRAIVCMLQSKSNHI